MAKNLKAENLTISVPNTGCNKNCPYCVSRMTGYMDHDFDRMILKAEKVKTVARAAEITSILFTGKGEPTFGDSFRMLERLIRLFNEFPLELQTNGILLNENPNWLDQLHIAGLDTVAVSIDKASQLKKYEALWKKIKDLNMVSRVTVNINGLMDSYHPDWWVQQCITNGIHQLTFRRLTVPEINVDKKTAEWVSKNAPDYIYNDMVHYVTRLIKKEGRLIRNLKNGIQIWDIGGVAVTTSDYCIQERDEGDNLRSLVYQEDGHLYTGWGSKASILF